MAESNTAKMKVRKPKVKASAESATTPKKAAPRRKARKSKAKVLVDSASAKRTPWAFPKNTLEDALVVAKEIEEKNAGNPLPAQDLAVAVGFRQASDWRFLDLLRSANLYGLVTGTGQGASIHLAKIGQDVVAPSSPHQRSEALLEAFRNVKDFQAVEGFYGGKRIPEDEFFRNTLTREFDIPRDRVEQFAKVFLENLRYLRAFSAVPASTEAAPDGVEAVALGKPAEKVVPSSVVSKEPRGREFLDTCFVMMPFGPYFDSYYQKIYVPAIKDAGFEPVRADELFTTGSVVEQIWEQIEKSKLLLADLSGKNPNVFYELGLAHAARKPVVFTSGQLEDVPFDLRHLRVIIYDVREPEWAPKLRASITDYLRNATKEPEKSIPHPFRKIVEDAESAPSRPSRRT